VGDGWGQRAPPHKLGVWDSAISSQWALDPIRGAYSNWDKSYMEITEKCRPIKINHVANVLQVSTMDDPPPPYSSFDESKGAGYPPKSYPMGPPPQNQYGATSYPAAAAYQGPPHVAPGPASSFYPAMAEPQPRIVIAPAGFSRFGGMQMQSIRQRYSTYSTHILLSCFVICCCGPGGFMCGLLAFCVASMLFCLSVCLSVCLFLNRIQGRGSTGQGVN